jgi:DNA-binding transcriptional LysR family regulator
MREAQVFVTVADLRSVGKAARLLMIDPSTASKMLRNLERDLGCRLVDRTTGHVKGLTPAGVVALEHCRRMLQESAHLLAACEGFGSEPGMRRDSADGPVAAVSA